MKHVDDIVMQHDEAQLDKQDCISRETALASVAAVTLVARSCFPGAGAL